MGKGIRCVFLFIHSKNIIPAAMYIIFYVKRKRHRLDWKQKYLADKTI